jgi:hypothetical protein
VKREAGRGHRGGEHRQETAGGQARP